MATKTTSKDVVLREIRPDDTVSGLSLGDAAFTPLKTFLKKCARRYHTECLAKTYVYTTPENKVVAYISLICSQIEVDDVGCEVKDYDYRDLPAVKIARLAVDQDYRKSSLGKNLVSMAIAISTTQIVPHVGCRFIVVDSKQQSLKFYEKCGFRMLDSANNKKRHAPVMFMDLWKL